MNKRGIIISPTPSTTKIAGRESIDPAYLRQCLLYWDMIDCPNDRFLKVVLNRNLKDIELLQKEGIFIRTEGTFFAKKSPHYKIILSMHDDHPNEFWALAQLYAFEKHNRSGNTFSIGQFNNNLIFAEIDPAEAFFFVETGPFDKDQTSNILGLSRDKLFSTKNELERGPIVELELHQAIPIAIADEPLEKILEFKIKRQDELQHFRHAMDGFYLTVINSRDILRAKSYVIEQIDLSLCDLSRVMNESRLKYFLSNTNITVNFPEPSEIAKNVAIGGASGGSLGSMIGLPKICAAIGAGYGALTSFIKVSIKPEAFKPKRIPDNLKDFAYIYHAKQQFGKN
jgi:hypothetical protein